MKKSEYSVFGIRQICAALLYSAPGDAKMLFYVLKLQPCRRITALIVATVAAGATANAQAPAANSQIVRFQLGFDGTENGKACNGSPCLSTLGYEMHVGRTKILITSYDLNSGGVGVSGDQASIRVPAKGGKGCQTIQGRSQALSNGYDTFVTKVCATIRPVGAGAYSIGVDLTRQRDNQATRFSSGQVNPESSTKETIAFSARLSLDGTGPDAQGLFNCRIGAASMQSAFTLSSTMVGKPYTNTTVKKSSGLSPDWAGTYCRQYTAEIPF